MHHLIYNPVAGRGRARRALPRAVAFFERHGLPLEVLTTAGAGDARRLAEALPPDARVLVLGGDGTVHEVASACIDTPRTLGVLPVGSGDDFAFALGLARGDLEGALRAVQGGRSRRVDTGVVNGRPFVNVVGVGFDADVADRVGRTPRALRGRGAYLYAILATLGGLALRRVEVLVDGARAYAGPALLVTTHNGPRAGGSYLFAPDADVQNGTLDVIVAGRFGRLGAVGILPRVARGGHLTHPEVFAFRGRRISLAWEVPRPGHAEGERLPPSARFDIEVRPRSLRVFA